MSNSNREQDGPKLDRQPASTGERAGRHDSDLAQSRIDALLRQSTDPFAPSFDGSVLAEARFGLDHPLSLTPLQTQRICFAVVAIFAGQGIV